MRIEFTPTSQPPSREARQHCSRSHRYSWVIGREPNWISQGQRIEIQVNASKSSKSLGQCIGLSIGLSFQGLAFYRHVLSVAASLDLFTRACLRAVYLLIEIRTRGHQGTLVIYISLYAATYISTHLPIDLYTCQGLMCY